MILGRPISKACVVACLGLSLPGCVGPTFIVQQYDGPVRPRETIAIVRLKGDERVRLVALDGGDADAPLDSDVRLHIEVLPGEHTLHVADGAAPERPIQRLLFRAAPGRTYHVFFVRNAPGAADPATPVARVYEVSDDSDTPLRDVTLAKPRAP